jgi:hypothetical protein
VRSAALPEDRLQAFQVAPAEHLVAALGHAQVSVENEHAVRTLAQVGRYRTRQRYTPLLRSS